MDKILYLVRGPSGNGKSTTAHSICDTVFEADSFFMKEGRYEFEPSRLPEAHAKCLSDTRRAMQAGTGKIAVANTFTTEWEMKPYIESAALYGYMLISLIVERRHEGKNVHNVPQEVVDKQAKRFQIKLY